MVPLIVLAVLGCLIGIRIIKRSGYPLYPLFVKVFISTAATCVGVLLGVVASVIIGFTLLPTEDVLIKEARLIPVTIGEQKIFFNTANIQSIEYILFFKQEEKEITLGVIPLRISVINKEERDDGKVKIYEEKFGINWHRYLGVEPERLKYEFFVPTKSAP